MYKKILVPIDIKEEVLTQNALRNLVYLAKMSNAKVHFLYVLPDSQAFVNAYAFGIKEFENKEIEEADEEIKAMISKVALPVENLSYEICFGSPRDETLAKAKEIDADLIIIGSHRPSVTTYLLGSNASGIVRHAAVSVMVVR